jgi:hypothetical protein
VSIINEGNVRARLEKLAKSKGSTCAVNSQYLLQPGDRAWNPCRSAGEILGSCQLTYTRYPDGLISAIAMFWQEQ